QYRLLGGYEPGQAGDRPDRHDPGEIGMGKHAVLAPGRLLDSANAGMRERAAQKLNFQHSRQPNVGDELAAAAQKPVILLARQRRADAFTGSGWGSRRGRRHRLNSASAPLRWPSFAAISTRTRAISVSSSAMYASSSAIPIRVKSFGCAGLRRGSRSDSSMPSRSPSVFPGPTARLYSV